jgi:hypothetical protein
MTTTPSPDLWGPTQQAADDNLRGAGPLGEALADTMREQLAEPEPGGTGDPGEAPELPNLPVPIGDNTGQLDLDTLREALPNVRDDLVLALRHAARQHRAARGTVVTPEDTYPLVRRLTEADELLGQWSRAFSDAAKEARAIIEEEALTVAGAESDGMLSASLFVPDGAGRRIAVRADYKAGSSTWDVATLVGWVIEQEVAEQAAAIKAERRERHEARQAAADPGAEGIEPEPLDELNRAAEAAWYPSDAQAVAHEVVMRLLALGSYTPSAAKVKALRVKLAEQQRDADAAVIAQVRSVGERQYLGVKVTREDAPAGGAA